MWGRRNSHGFKRKSDKHTYIPSISERLFGWDLGLGLGGSHVWRWAVVYYVRIPPFVMSDSHMRSSGGSRGSELRRVRAGRSKWNLKFL